LSKVHKCMVEECHYNNAATCNADSVQIRSSNDEVTTSDHTCCETFRPKQTGMTQTTMK